MGRLRQNRLQSAGKRRLKRMTWLGEAYERLSLPLTVFFLFTNPQFRPKYAMTWRKKFSLGFRFYRNTRRIRTGLSYKAHLAMAAKLLEISPAVEGAVVECGCWLGGTTANLSLICDIVGRDLIVYDEYVHLYNCSLFFSERFWRDYLDTFPPGLMGTGTGVGVGQFFLGHWRGNPPAPRIQRPTSLAYTRKDFPQKLGLRAGVRRVFRSTVGIGISQ